MTILKRTSLLLALAAAPLLAFAQTAQIVNPLGNNTFCTLLKGILNALFILGLPVAVLFIAYSGFLFVTARGKSEQISHARDTLLWTVVGIAVFFGAWVIAGVITNTINPFLTGGATIDKSCGQ